MRKLTQDARSVCKADVDACYDAGWDGDAIFRAIMLTGMYGMMMRWVSATGIRYTPEEVIASSDGLTGKGYAGEGPGLTDEEYHKQVKYQGTRGSTESRPFPRGDARDTSS